MYKPHLAYPKILEPNAHLRTKRNMRGCHNLIEVTSASPALLCKYWWNHWPLSYPNEYA